MIHSSLYATYPSYKIRTTITAIFTTDIMSRHVILVQTDLQQLWRQVFCSCRSEAVEQPSSWTATSWH